MSNTLTAEDIANIVPGVTIERGCNGRWGLRGKVTKVTARGVDVKGNAYVCFYTTFGENAEMSGSATAGDVNRIRFVE